MSDLSVAEKDVGAFLTAHASALTSAVNVLKTVTAFLPIPAAEVNALTGVVSGLENLAGSVTTVAADVNSASTLVKTTPINSTGIVEEVEKAGTTALFDAAEDAFAAWQQGETLPQIEKAAETGAIDEVESIIAKPTSN